MRPFRIACLFAGLFALACGESDPTGSDGDPTIPVSITTTSLPDGVEGSAYSETLVASGGPIAWRVVSGNLPGGLGLDPMGTLSGTPTESGTFSFTVDATGIYGQSDQQALSLVVYPALEVGTTSLPDATVDTPYSESLTVTGGDGTYTWSLNGGSLPTGLGLDASSGEISGTPTVVETQGFTAWVESGDGQTAYQELSITVAAGGPTTLLPTEYCSDYGPSAIGSFESTALESAVRAELGRGSSDPLTCQLLAGIVELEAKDMGIPSIAGIQNLIGLTYLRLDGNFAISDISWLSGLTNLTEELDLSENAITDVSALSGMTSLLDLNLATNGISDVSPLSGLIALADLNLNSNSIADITPLGGLTNLESLELGGSTVTDFSPLAALTSLTSLEHRNAGLTDLTGLGTLTSLAFVDFSGNALTDISGLETLTSLGWVQLNNNTALSDIQPLIDNAGIGAGDSVDLQGTAVTCTDVTTLQSTGASDCP